MLKAEMAEKESKHKDGQKFANERLVRKAENDGFRAEND